MFTKKQLEAVEAGIDVAYTGADDDRERLEMEDHARQALGIMKALTEEGKPTGAHWGRVSPARKQAGVILIVKQVASHSKSKTVILMPDEDYRKLAARMLYLERQHIEDAKMISRLREESGMVEMLPPREEVLAEEAPSARVEGAVE